MFRIELEEALEVIENNTQKIEEKEEISLDNCLGRICAEDIFSPMFNPPFDRSPLDGYAIIAADSKGASKENPVSLKVVDEVFAGGSSKVNLKSMEAVRIMTGAKLPQGSNAVIRQENTDEGMEKVLIYEELKDYDNYCFKGEDIKERDLLIKKGEKFNYIHVGILSSVGINRIKVYRKPKIALLVTGDEVQMLGCSLKEGKIYDTNLNLLSARIKTLGFDLFSASHIEDNTENAAMEISKVIDESDVVITTGGVSVGKKDIFHNVLPKLKTERLFWKVKLKPGTPVMFSLFKGKPILSLSGNPFAALATFELLARPLLYKLSGDKDLITIRKKAVIENDFNKKSKVRRFVRAYYEEGKVRFINNKHSSGMMSSMNGCNCLIDIEHGNMGIKTGDEVNIILI